MYFPPDPLRLFTFHSFNKYLLRTYYVPGTELGPRIESWPELSKVPALLQRTAW